MKLALEIPDETLEAIAQRAAAIAVEALGELVADGREWGEYLRPADAARYMGVSRQRVYDLVSSGRLPRFKDGSTTLVRRVDVDAYLAGERIAQVLPTARRGRPRSRVAA